MNLENNSGIHLKLSRKCLGTISQELAQIDMEVLKTQRSSWLPTISTNLPYAIMFWADHTKLSQHCSDDLLDHIMITFSPNSKTVEKWWLVHLTEVCRISHDVVSQHHNTTVLHLLAYFGLHELLKRACAGEHWRQLQKFLDTLDCMNASPLDLALLRNQHEAAKILVTAGTEIKLSHILHVAESNVELVGLIFHHYNGKPLVRAQMVNLLERSVTSGSEELVSLTIEFMVQNGEKNIFPWNETHSFMHAIELGYESFFKHLIKITNLESTTEELISSAVRSHEEIALMVLMKRPQI